MERESWKSRIGFVLAAVGSAIGLGNIWRFNYLAYKNGGGAFLIPYLLALVIVGIPILILEFSIGHATRGGAALAMRKATKNRFGEFVGWWAISNAMFGIMLYYAVVVSWAVNYFYFAFSMKWSAGSGTAEFFGNFLGNPEGFFNFSIPTTSILVGLAVVWLVNWLIGYLGVEKGLERANKIFMPLLFILSIIIVIRGLTLDGAGEGVKKYIIPDFSKLSNFQVWIDGFSQTFFTLSLGFGIMIAYASYLPKKHPIIQDSFYTGLINDSFSLMVGFGVFGVVGYLAHIKGVPIDQLKLSGPGLAFITFPEAISQMKFIPTVFGVIFFLSLVIAGLSSTISLIEAFIASYTDKFGGSRKKIITTITVVGFLGGMVFTTKSGVNWLDAVDSFLTSMGLVGIALLEVILISWIFGSDKIIEHAYETSDLNLSSKIKKLWSVLVKFVVPAILAVLFVLNLINLAGKFSSTLKEISELKKNREKLVSIMESISDDVIMKNAKEKALKKIDREISSAKTKIIWFAVGFGWFLVTLILALIFTFRKWRNEKTLAPDYGHRVEEAPF